MGIARSAVWPCVGDHGIKGIKYDRYKNDIKGVKLSQLGIKTSITMITRTHFSFSDIESQIC